MISPHALDDNKLVKVFGQEKAGKILERTLDNVKAGQFDLEEEKRDVEH